MGCVEVRECHVGEKVDISQSALDGILPLNGLRHPKENDTTGWYIWGGEQLSEDEDYFKPLHTAHLELKCTLALKFLSLPPGWRFLTDGTYEDVWFDANLFVTI
ncbi:immunity protein Imm33 domain-containing protein [Ruegeria haliotis]